MRGICIFLIVVSAVTANGQAQKPYYNLEGLKLQQGIAVDQKAALMDGTEVEYDTLTNIIVGHIQEETESSFQLEAYAWISNDIGNMYKYIPLSSTEELDESAVGIDMVSATTFAIVIHQSLNWTIDTVKAEDVLILSLVDTSGSVIWSTTEINEGGGIAPTDVKYDGDESIYVLYNRIDDEGTIQVGYFVYDLSGNKIATSSLYGSKPNGNYATEFVFNSDQEIATVTHNYTFKFSETLLWNSSHGISLIDSIDNQRPNRLYGIDYDPTTGTFVTAGYFVEEDTAALIVKLDLNVSPIAEGVFNRPGMEKFRDVAAFDNSYIAGGICDNGVNSVSQDQYFVGLNKNFTIRFEEVLGDTLRETMNSLFEKDRIHVYSSGGEWANALGEHSFGFGFMSGIQAYVTKNWDNTWQRPRAILVDNLIQPDTRLKYYGDDPDGQTSEITLQARVTNDFEEFNIVFLYDADRILTTDFTGERRDALYRFISRLILAGKKVGIIVGPSIQKINQVNDLMTGVMVANLPNPGFINFVMLEHEFWRWDDVDANTNPDTRKVPILDHNDYGSSLTSDNLLNIGDPKEQEFFWHLTRDHYMLLFNIKVKLRNYQGSANPQNDPNLHALFDYVGLPWGNNYPFSFWGDPRAATWNIAKDPSFRINSKMDYGEAAVDAYNEWADYTLLVYYRRYYTNGISPPISNNMSSTYQDPTCGTISIAPNYDHSGSPSSDFSDRLTVYQTVSQNLGRPIILLPLYSVEPTEMGPWFSNCQNMRLNEDIWLDQFDSNSSIVKTPGVIGRIYVPGFGYYQYSDYQGLTMDNSKNSTLNRDVWGTLAW